MPPRPHGPGLREATFLQAHNSARSSPAPLSWEGGREAKGPELPGNIFLAPCPGSRALSSPGGASEGRKGPAGCGCCRPCPQGRGRRSQTDGSFVSACAQQPPPSRSPREFELARCSNLRSPPLTGNLRWAALRKPGASEALPPGPQGLGWGAGSAGDGGAGLGRPLPPKAPENSSKSPRPPCVGSGEVGFLEVQPQSRLMMAQQGCLPLLGEGGRGRSVSLALFGPPPRLAPAPQPDPALVRGQACGSARLRSCQLARPARLPWQPLSMSAGPAAPSSSLAGARATSGRPRGLPGRGGLPRGPLGSWA